MDHKQGERLWYYKLDKHTCCRAYRKFCSHGPQADICITVPHLPFEIEKNNLMTETLLKDCKLSVEGQYRYFLCKGCIDVLAACHHNVLSSIPKCPQAFLPSPGGRPGVILGRIRGLVQKCVQHHGGTRGTKGIERTAVSRHHHHTSANHLRRLDRLQHESLFFFFLNRIQM